MEMSGLGGKKFTGSVAGWLLALGVTSVASNVNAQEKFSLPNLMKGAVPAQPAATQNDGKPAMGAQSSDGASERQGASSGSGAPGFRGEFVFPQLTLTGKGVRSPGSSRNIPGALYGRHVSGVNAGDHFQVAVFDESGNSVLELKVMGTLAQLAKVPYSTHFERRGDKDATAVLSYGVSGVSCFPLSGVVTITSFGGVDDFVSGTIQNIKWGSQMGQRDCATILGTGAKFKVPRALDFETFKR